ncbi:hypothetical protein RHGRI_038839 [Rhododendron griersonianum]|uniref:Uncharacterized protein n=1 Tax=Rhododendron griersonianum TaxID=479676 RepID=A0AAV6HI64_9ERIC|nr:hypothetical protein RHGRI_038839 [Rhododendron griersonianum]
MKQNCFFSKCCELSFMLKFSKKEAASLWLGLLFGPMSMGIEDPVQELLGHRLTPPLLGRYSRRVHQCFPLILHNHMSPRSKSHKVQGPTIHFGFPNIPSRSRLLNSLNQCFHFRNRERSTNSALRSLRSLGFPRRNHSTCPNIHCWNNHQCSRIC